MEISLAYSAKTNKISVDVSEDELRERRKAWKKSVGLINRGTLAKYTALVRDASHRAMADLF
jgi:dihydroxy-acid dehydratase